MVGASTVIPSAVALRTGNRTVAVIAHGFMTGLLLQAAIGPVFFFILNTAIRTTPFHGACAVLGVALADSIYIALAVLGVGKLLEKPGIKHLMGICSSVVLVAFGAIMIISAARTGARGVQNAAGVSNHLSSFLSAFLLTISSPLTIVFWTGLFAAQATEKGYSRRQLAMFGLAAGTATLVFLGLAVALFSLIRASIPAAVVKTLNIVVGGLLIAYGIQGALRVFVNSRRPWQA
jgi:threonine/homoserine/homoserine lactone efflux protein